YTWNHNEIWIVNYFVRIRLTQMAKQKPRLDTSFNFGLNARQGEDPARHAQAAPAQAERGRLVSPFGAINPVRFDLAARGREGRSMRSPLVPPRPALTASVRPARHLDRQAGELFAT